MRRLLVGVVLALAVAGCGGDPKADPTPSPSPPSSSSTTPAPPVMPEAAKANTKAGAVAFVKYYIELINHAQATGETRGLSAVEDPGCASCQKATSGVQAHYAAGGTIKGGEWRVEQLVPNRSSQLHGWVVDLKVAYSKQIVSFGDGRPDQTNSAGELILSIQVRRTDGAWEVLEWTRGG